MTAQELARLRERAGQDHPEALYRLAMLHIYGDGVPEDNDLAAALLLRAARQGHAEAQYNLGICYHHGYGVAADEAEAFRWYMVSARQGYAMSGAVPTPCCRQLPVSAWALA